MKRKTKRALDSWITVIDTWGVARAAKIESEGNVINSCVVLSSCGAVRGIPLSNTGYYGITSLPTSIQVMWRPILWSSLYACQFMSVVVGIASQFSQRSCVAQLCQQGTLCFQLHELWPASSPTARSRLGAGPDHCAPSGTIWTRRHDGVNRQAVIDAAY